MASARPLLTLLVPCYNEAANLPAAYERIETVMAQLRETVDYEVIVLDNRSEDRTRGVAKDLCSRNLRWRYVRYSRNFGYHASLACGFDVARGDALVVIAGDLQEPPEMIPRMIEIWREGNDVVYGVLKRRSDESILKTVGAWFAYRLIYWLSDSRIPPSATDFRLIDRKVIDAIRRMSEPDRYLRGMVHWVGFRQASFPYDRDPRRHGESSGGLWVSIRMAVHAIICFSHMPLRAMAYFGLLVMLGALAFGLFFLYVYFARPLWIPEPPSGMTGIALLLVFAIGLNALFLGLIGEYVGRIYNQGKSRPLYIIDEKVNFD